MPHWPLFLDFWTTRHCQMVQQVRQRVFRPVTRAGDPQKTPKEQSPTQQCSLRLPVTKRSCFRQPNSTKFEAAAVHLPPTGICFQVTVISAAKNVSDDCPLWNRHALVGSILSGTCTLPMTQSHESGIIFSIEAANLLSGAPAVPPQRPPGQPPHRQSQ